MHANLLRYTRFPVGFAKGLLHGRKRDAAIGDLPQPSASTTADQVKQPCRVAMVAPARLQQRQDRLGQRHIALLGSLAVDTQQTTHPVDVGDPDLAGFMKPQPTGIDQAQARAVAHRAYTPQDRLHLLMPQHHGHLLLALGRRHAGQRPVPLEGLLVEELDPAQSDGHRRSRQLAFARQMHEVLPDLLFAQPVGRAHEIAREPFHRAHIRLLCPLREPVQLHIVDHALTQRRNRIPLQRAHLLEEELQRCCVRLTAAADLIVRGYETDLARTFHQLPAVMT